MHFLGSKCLKNVFAAGEVPDPPAGGAYSAPQTP